MRRKPSIRLLCVLGLLALFTGCAPKATTWYHHDTGCPRSEVTSKVVEPDRRYEAQGCGQQAAYACVDGGIYGTVGCKSVIFASSHAVEVVSSEDEAGQTHERVLIRVSPWTLLTIRRREPEGFTVEVHTLTAESKVDESCPPVLYAGDHPLEARLQSRKLENMVDNSVLELSAAAAQKLRDTALVSVRTCHEKSSLPPESAPAIARMLDEDSSTSGAEHAVGAPPAPLKASTAPVISR